MSAEHRNGPDACRHQHEQLPTEVAAAAVQLGCLPPDARPAPIIRPMSGGPGMLAVAELIRTRQDIAPVMVRIPQVRVSGHP